MLLPVLILVGAAPAKATTYYISMKGDDTYNGQSPTSPWATLARINSLRLSPGDQVLLRGGDTFRGSLHVNKADQGVPGLPIVIGSYGHGRAHIVTPETGIFIENVAHITIRDLILESATRKSTSSSGIAILNTLPGNTKLSDISVGNVLSHGSLNTEFLSLAKHATAPKVALPMFGLQGSRQVKTVMRGYMSLGAGTKHPSFMPIATCTLVTTSPIKIWAFRATGIIREAVYLLRISMAH